MMLRISWIAILLSICSADVFANSIVPVSGQAARYVADSSIENMLYVAPPNAAGISINRFTTFTATSPLLLVNTPTYQLTTGAPVSPARTVVLIAEKFDLRTSINVVGPATDVVLLTNSANGNINCLSCSFNNVLRLSLLATKYRDVTSLANQLGNFDTMGSVTISGLSAPGALGLDVLAATMKTSGEITLNQRVMSSVNGGYSATPTGKYSMGSGAIDFVSGSVTWNYEKKEIRKVSDTSSLQEFAGTIKSPRVSISSGNNVRFIGKIDTRVDVIGAVSYHDKTHLPQEGVVLQALSKGAGSGVDVIISGDIYSDSSVELRATRDVTTEKTAEITALKLAGLSGRATKNFGQLRAAQLSLAGGTIENEGLLESGDVIHLWAEQDLANQYGGVVRSPKIVLDSATTVVRNGSRTPYRTEASNRNRLFDLSSSEVLTALEQDLEINPSTLDSSRLGAYYLLPGSMLVVNDGSVRMPIEHTAHIIGNTILVRAPGFENINPYYEKVNDQNEVNLQRKYVNQVMISAESLLEIQGAEGSAGNRSEYVINSSGLVSVNSKSGKLRVQSKRFINNRFRIATFLLKNDSTSSADSTPVWVMEQTTLDKAFISATSVYSPPGFLSVLGKAEINATMYFANIMGYVEVFSGADINSLQLKNLGLANEGVGKSVTKTVVMDHYDFRPFVSTESATFAKDPRDLDSLFFVSGELNASNVNAWFGVLNPFHHFMVEAVESREGDIRSQIGHHLTVYNSSNCHTVYPGPGQPGCENRRFVIGSLEASIDPKSVMAGASSDKINFNYDIDVNRSWGGYYGSGYKPDEIQKASGENSLGLFETLEKYYEKIKSKFSAMLNEFDWWGLAA